jgi:hypothetical protein
MTEKIATAASACVSLPLNIQSLRPTGTRRTPRDRWSSTETKRWLSKPVERMRIADVQGSIRTCPPCLRGSVSPATSRVKRSARRSRMSRRSPRPAPRLWVRNLSRNSRSRRHGTAAPTSSSRRPIGRANSRVDVDRETLRDRFNSARASRSSTICLSPASYRRDRGDVCGLGLTAGAAGGSLRCNRRSDEGSKQAQHLRWGVMAAGDSLCTCGCVSDVACVELRRITVRSSG